MKYHKLGFFPKIVGEVHPHDISKGGGSSYISQNGHLHGSVETITSSRSSGRLSPFRIAI